MLEKIDSKYKSHKQYSTVLFLYFNRLKICYNFCKVSSLYVKNNFLVWLKPWNLGYNIFFYPEPIRNTACNCILFETPLVALLTLHCYLFFCTYCIEQRILYRTADTVSNSGYCIEQRILYKTADTV